MKKNFMYKFLISILILLGLKVYAQSPNFVSLSPALTEIMYSIGAENSLIGVSSACHAKNKEIIGDNFFINTEKILKLKPNYILALDSSDIALNKFKKFGIIPLCFKNPNIESIYQNILTLGKLTNRVKESENIVLYSKNKISNTKTHNPIKILYLVQTSPFITVGKKSFINDVINQSGNISITESLDYYYPTVSEEFCIKKHPDIIVISSFGDEKRVKKIFPKSKIIIMTKEQNDIINQPSSKIYKSVEFFASLSK